MLSQCRLNYSKKEKENCSEKDLFQWYKLIDKQLVVHVLNHHPEKTSSAPTWLVSIIFLWPENAVLEVKGWRAFSVENNVYWITYLFWLARMSPDRKCSLPEECLCLRRHITEVIQHNKHFNYSSVWVEHSLKSNHNK